MKALVTGGAGFIGSHIVDELRKEKADVVVLDDLSTGRMENLPSGGIEFMKGSITDRELLENAVKDVDYIFHEAAMVSVAESIKHPAQTWEINIRGTKLLLNAAVKAGVKRVVFASSDSVYGNALPPLKEDKDVKPISPYGDSKRMGEILMQEYYSKEKLETVSLRYFNVYGPRQSPEFGYAGVIPNFIARMIKNEGPVIFGNGMQTRDFILVKDVVRANMLALKLKKGRGDIFNIATGNSVSISELVKTLNSVLGTQLEPLFEPERDGDIKYSLADMELSKKKLGFEANVTLEHGLKETVDWFREKVNKNG